MVNACARPNVESDIAHPGRKGWDRISSVWGGIQRTGSKGGRIEIDDIKDWHTLHDRQ
jgi:hypothetical protein